MFEGLEGLRKALGDSHPLTKGLRDLNGSTNDAPAIAVLFAMVADILRGDIRDESEPAVDAQWDDAIRNNVINTSDGGLSDPPSIPGWVMGVAEWARCNSVVPPRYIIVTEGDGDGPAMVDWLWPVKNPWAFRIRFFEGGGFLDSEKRVDMGIYAAMNHDELTSRGSGFGDVARSAALCTRMLTLLYDDADA